jgi:hypothetical protein
MNDVREVSVSIRQIVAMVFLIWGHLRLDYKSCRTMILGLFVYSITMLPRHNQEY